MAYDTLPHFRRLQAALNTQKSDADGQVRPQQVFDGTAVRYAGSLQAPIDELESDIALPDGGGGSGVAHPSLPEQRAAQCRSQA